MKKLFILICIMVTQPVYAEPKASASIFYDGDIGAIIDVGSKSFRGEIIGVSNPGFSIKKSFSVTDKMNFWVGIGKNFVNKVTTDNTGNWDVKRFSKDHLYTTIFAELEFDLGIFLRLSHYETDLSIGFYETDINGNILSQKIVNENSQLNKLMLGYKWAF